MKSTGHCSHLDLVLFFATAIGIAAGQFSVRPCRPAGDELAIPYVIYVFDADSKRIVCSTTAAEVNSGWGFRAGDNGMFTVTDETIANHSCVEGNELRVRNVPSLSEVVSVPGTFNITFTSTSAEIELQVNHFPKGFYVFYDGPALSLEIGKDSPPLWSSYAIAGLSVTLCEQEAGGGLNESTLFSLRTPDRQEPCLEGMGQVQISPLVYTIGLIREIFEEDVGTHMLVLVEGNCTSSTLTSDPVTVNVSLPTPEPNLTTSMTPTSTSIFTTPTPSPNSSTVTPTPSPNATDDPSSSGSGGLSTGVVIAIVVVLVVLVALAVLVFIGAMVFVIRKEHRKREHILSRPPRPDSDLTGPVRYMYQPGPGPITELSESGPKQPLEGDLVEAGLSREPAIASIQKSSVFITAEDSAFYKDLRKRLAKECHTSVHQPDLTDHRHFPQLISRLLIDQNCEWVFLIGSHTLEHRLENGLDHKPVWRAMQELTTAAYPEDQLSKVVYVQLGAPSLRTIETPVTTILIPSSSNTPDYTGTQCADEILQDPKVKKRLVKMAAANGIAKPLSLLPRQVERLLGGAPASDPTHRRGVEQPDGANGATESGSLTNMLSKVHESIQEQTKVMKDIRDSSAAQVGLQATIAESAGKTASHTGEIKKDAAEARQNTQQILDQQQGAEGGEDETENGT